MKGAKRPFRNWRRLHLQCQVTKGKALPAKKERQVRRHLKRLLRVEGLTGRRWERLVEKRRRPV